MKNNVYRHIALFICEQYYFDKFNEGVRPFGVCVYMYVCIFIESKNGSLWLPRRNIQQQQQQRHFWHVDRISTLLDKSP